MLYKSCDVLAVVLVLSEKHFQKFRISDLHFSLYPYKSILLIVLEIHIDLYYWSTVNPSFMQCIEKLINDRHSGLNLYVWPTHNEWLLKVWITMGHVERYQNSNRPICPSGKILLLIWIHIVRKKIKYTNSGCWMLIRSCILNVLSALIIFLIWLWILQRFTRDLILWGNFYPQV